MPQHAANRQIILNTIEAVEATINSAEKELEVVVQALGVEPRSQKQLAAEPVREAFAKLDASKVRLAMLERMVADDVLEQASAAIVEAEKSLDRAIVEIVTVDAEKTLMSDVVSAAFTRLRAARQKLHDLEASIEVDPD